MKLKKLTSIVSMSLCLAISTNQISYANNNAEKINQQSFAQKFYYLNQQNDESQSWGKLYGTPYLGGKYNSYLHTFTQSGDSFPVDFNDVNNNFAVDYSPSEAHWNKSSMSQTQSNMSDSYQKLHTEGSVDAIFASMKISFDMEESFSHASSGIQDTASYEYFMRGPNIALKNIEEIINHKLIDDATAIEKEIDPTKKLMLKVQFYQKWGDSFVSQVPLASAAKGTYNFNYENSLVATSIRQAVSASAKGTFDDIAASGSVSDEVKNAMKKATAKSTISMSALAYPVDNPYFKDVVSKISGEADFSKIASSTSLKAAGLDDHKDDMKKDGNNLAMSKQGIDTTSYLEEFKQAQIAYSNNDTNKLIIGDRLPKDYNQYIIDTSNEDFETTTYQELASKHNELKVLENIKPFNDFINNEIPNFSKDFSDSVKQAFDQYVQSYNNYMEVLLLQQMRKYTSTFKADFPVFQGITQADMDDLAAAYKTIFITTQSNLVKAIQASLPHKNNQANGLVFNNVNDTLNQLLKADNTYQNAINNIADYKDWVEAQPKYYFNAELRFPDYQSSNMKHYIIDKANAWASSSQNLDTTTALKFMVFAAYKGHSQKDYGMFDGYLYTPDIPNKSNFSLDRGFIARNTALSNISVAYLDSNASDNKFTPIELLKNNDGTLSSGSYEVLTRKANTSGLSYTYGIGGALPGNNVSWNSVTSVLGAITLKPAIKSNVTKELLPAYPGIYNTKPS
jgi:hypothetical protein